MVLLSSCVLLSMTLIITPLIAGIFDDTALTKPMLGSATRSTIPPGVGDFNRLSPAFTYTAYDYAWLNGSLPPFTTPTYSLLPVLNDTGIHENETWTAETTQYAADLTCESAKAINVVRTNGSDIEITITAQDGGTVRVCDSSLFDKYLEPSGDVDISRCDTFTTFYTPWTSVATRVNPDSWNGGPATYMYGWMAGPDPGWESTLGASPVPRNITAIFCTTSYYSQPVMANFMMPSGQVINVTSKGNRTPFPEVNHFEEIINGKLSKASIPDEYKEDGEPIAFGYLPDQLPNVNSQLRRWLGPRPDNLEKHFPPVADDTFNAQSSSIVYIEDVHELPGFALFNQRTPDTLGRLLDPEILAETYTDSLQLLFALAVAMEMVQDDINPVSVTRGVLVRGFRVNLLWARGAQGGLLVVVVTVVALGLLVGRRPCKLDGEPNSLQVALRLLSVSPELCEEMEGAEFQGRAAMLKVFKQRAKRYTLELVPEPKVQVTSGREPEESDILISNDQDPWQAEMRTLSTASGVGYILCFVVIAVLLVIAFVYSRAYNGKLDNDIPQCITNFVPGRIPDDCSHKLLRIQGSVFLYPSCLKYFHGARASYHCFMPLHARPLQSSQKWICSKFQDPFS